MERQGIDLFLLFLESSKFIDPSGKLANQDVRSTDVILTIFGFRIRQVIFDVICHVADNR